LEIIRIRFSTDFQSHIYVNEKFMSCPVVKLIMQPIVENAVKYAIEPMAGKGAILVSAYDEKEDLIIEIVDNGPGIADDKMEELKKRLSIISSTESLNDNESESLGITNVHTRLVLKYGRGYGVHLDSFPGRGTVVSLRIPMLTNDQIHKIRC
jgi:two-component system sensor histidine kinase YesM